MKRLKNILLFVVLLAPQVQANDIIFPTEKPEIKIEKDGSITVVNEKNNKKSSNVTVKKENKIEDIDDIIDKIEKEYKFTGKTTENIEKQENNNKSYKFVGNTTNSKESNTKIQTKPKQTNNTKKEINKLTTTNKPKEVVAQKNEIKETKSTQTLPIQPIKQTNTNTKPTQNNKITNKTVQNTTINKQQEIDKNLETAIEEQQIDNINTKTIKNIPSNKNIFTKTEDNKKQEEIPNTIKEVVKKEEIKQPQQKIEKLERVVKKEDENKEIDYKFTGNTVNTQAQNNNEAQEQIKQVVENKEVKDTKKIIKKEEDKKEKPTIISPEAQQKIYKTELITGDIKQYNTKQNIKKETKDIVKTTTQPVKQYKKYPTKIVKSSNYSIEEPSNNLNLISQIEQNLLYNTSGQPKQQQSKNRVEIKKGGWSKEDLTEVKKDTKLKITTKSSTNIDLNIKQAEQNNKITSLKERAYEAVNLREYEIAIKLYKEILKLNKNDNFTKLSLATTYHILGQYVQAKPLYMELLPIFPNSEQLISNLLSIIIQESPYEAIYLLPSLAKKYSSSAVIQVR